MERIQVQILMHKNNAYLIQIMDGNVPRRVIVPALDLEDVNSEAEIGYITEEVLEMGIPHGIPWELHLSDLHVTSEEIANSLRKAGIWTYEDAQSDPQGRITALRDLTTPVLREINSLLKNYRS